MFKTNTGYNNCNDAFFSGKEKVFAEFNREEAEEISVDELFKLFYNHAKEKGMSGVSTFEVAVMATSTLLSGGGDYFKKGDEILVTEDADIVGVMGTGISTPRTTYARIDGRIFNIKWECARQFMKWEYWLALTSAARMVDGDPEKLLDENFI